MAYDVTAMDGGASDGGPSGSPGNQDDLIPGMSATPAVAAPVGIFDRVPPSDSFDVVLRGYERHQVDDHLAHQAATEAQLRSELEALAAREAAAQQELTAVRKELERGRPTFDALGERVSQMLGLAETEAEQMRADAARDAAELRERAATEAADVRSDARREAEELGAAARRELTSLKEERVDVLTDVAGMRDRLNDILAGTSEQWPSLAPADESTQIDLTSTLPSVLDEV
jgi:cell division septum initiation protein DivIVA